MHLPDCLLLLISRFLQVALYPETWSQMRSCSSGGWRLQPSSLLSASTHRPGSAARTGLVYIQNLIQKHTKQSCGHRNSFLFWSTLHPQLSFHLQDPHSDVITTATTFFPGLITRVSLVNIEGEEIRRTDAWVLPIRRCQREREIIPPSGLWKKRRETESLLTQPPLWKSSHQFVRRDVVYQNSRPGSPPSGRGGRTCSSLLEIRNVPFTVRVRKIKPTVSESSVTDIDTPLDRKALAASPEGEAVFPPAVLPAFPSRPSPPTSPVVRAPSVPNYNPSSRFTAHSREPLQQEW